MIFGRFFRVLRQELRSALHDGLLLLCALILALGAVAAVGPLTRAYLEGRQTTGILSVALVDEEDSFYTRLVLDAIQNAPSVAEGLTLIPADRTVAEQLLAENAVCAAVIVPAGFVESVQSGQFLSLEVILNETLPFGAALVEETVHSGVYLMSAVQNSLYGVYWGLADLGLEPAELDRQFNRQMITLISEALTRDAIFTSETLSPWRGGIFAHYMSSVLLLFLCALGLYHLARRSQSERTALSARMQALGWPRQLLAGADLTASTLLLALLGGVLTLTVAGFCGTPPLKTLAALGFAALFSLYVCALSHAALPLGQASPLVLGGHFACLLLAGALVPQIYLFPGGESQILTCLLPHAAFHRALTTVLTGGRLPSALYLVCAAHTALALFLALRPNQKEVRL